MASMAELLKVFDKSLDEGVVVKGNGIVDVDRIPTGIFTLDLKLGGGIPKGKMTVVYGVESSNKCHAKGDKVLLYTGRTKNVEDIVVGDMLAGTDGTPRTVLKVGNPDTGALYKVTPIRGGGTQTVNADHILSLYCTSNYGNSNAGDIVNISVKDYLAKSEGWKIYHHLYRVPVEFAPQEDLPLEPYFMGLWLGGGNPESCSITTTDSDIIDYLQDYADRLGLRLSVHDNSLDKCSRYTIVGDSIIGNPNKPNKVLRALGLHSGKHIPHSYKCASREDRLALLAGLIDSNGWRDSSGVALGYGGVNLELCEGVVFLARSLGYYAALSHPVIQVNGEDYQTHRVYMDGDFSDLPIQLGRKKPTPSTRSDSPLTTRFTVDEVAEGKFFGFELDGNHLYLTDSFIVNHNTNTCYKIIANSQRLYPKEKCVFVDLEGSFDPKWAAKMGIDTENLVLVQPDYAEETVDIVDALLHADDVGVVVLDSLAAMMTTNEGESSSEKAAVGGSAGIIGKLLRKSTKALRKARREGRAPTFICISQTRVKIGVMYGNPESFVGGNAPKFYSALTLRFYGKDIVDKAVHPERPCKKETKVIIKKFKVPITGLTCAFELVVLPHDGLKVGECNDRPAIMSYLKEYGWLSKHEKSWQLLGEEFRTQKEALDTVFDNQDNLDKIKTAIFEKAVADAENGDIE